MVQLRGWRYVAAMSLFVVGVGAFLYPVAIRPMTNPEPYKQQRELMGDRIRRHKDEPPAYLQAIREAEEKRKG